MSHPNKSFKEYWEQMKKLLQKHSIKNPEHYMTDPSAFIMPINAGAMFAWIPASYSQQQREEFKRYFFGEPSLIIIPLNECKPVMEWLDLNTQKDALIQMQYLIKSAVFSQPRHQMPYLN